MSELLKTFIQESLELLDVAETCVLELEKECLDHFTKDLNPENQELVNKFFRAIHTIKGNSGLFELENIKNLSHNFENLLTKVRDSEIPLKRDLIDISLLAIDRIREMIQNIDKIQDYNIKDLVENINKLLNVDNQSEKNHTEKNNHNNIDLESLYNKFIKKYQDKIKQYKEKLPIQHKLFYVLSFLEKNQLLSEFVNNIDQIKENNDISLINFNFILPSFNDRLYFYLFLSTEEDFSLPFPILLKKQIVLEEEPREEVLTNQKENIKSSTNIANPNEEESFLKVPASLVEYLINLAGESVIARNEFNQKIELLAKDNHELINSSKRISNYITLLQENLMKLRLQELNVLFERIPRLVRELSKETNKEVELEIEGGNIELDKTLIDVIRDPLTHLIRNAIDHGIEPPDIREKLGKPKKGRLTIKAFFQGGNVIIKVSDDGKGIDTNKVLEKAIEKNLISKVKAQELTKKEIINLIFLPGLSTAEKITERSGRGVGMDVVMSSLRKIKGFVDVQTEVNQGTTFVLTIPQTLSIVTCLIIEILNQKFAIQQNQIFEIIKINPEFLSELHGGLVYELREKIIPIIDPQNILKPKEKVSISQYNYIVFLETDQHIFGLLVNEILNPEELMIKPLGEEFHEIQYYSGASILGDGTTILIFDILGLVKSFHLESNKKDLGFDIESTTTQKTIQDQYLIFELIGNYYGISISYKPRIIEILNTQIEQLLDYYAFKYNHSIVPIIDVNELLLKKANLELFNKKSNYGILLPASEHEYISLLATDIINITNEFESFKKEEKASFIFGYAIYKDKTIMLLDWEKVLSFWNDKKLIAGIR